MLKKKNQILVSLSLVALLGGCSEEEVQRDVYNSLEDCLADWQKIELCEADKATQTADSATVGTTNTTETANNPATTEASGSEGASLGTAIAGAAIGYMAARAIGNFLGPSYNPNNRAVSTPAGQVIRPQGNHSSGKPMLVKGGAGMANSKPVSRGGFSSINSTKSAGG